MEPPQVIGAEKAYHYEFRNLLQKFLQKRLQKKKKARAAELVIVKEQGIIPTRFPKNKTKKDKQIMGKKKVNLEFKFSFMVLAIN